MKELKIFLAATLPIKKSICFSLLLTIALSSGWQVNLSHALDPDKSDLFPRSTCDDIDVRIADDIRNDAAVDKKSDSSLAVAFIDKMKLLYEKKYKIKIILNKNPRKKGVGPTRFTASILRYGKKIDSLNLDFGWHQLCDTSERIRTSIDYLLSRSPLVIINNEDLLSSVLQADAMWVDWEQGRIVNVEGPDGNRGDIEFKDRGYAKATFKATSDGENNILRVRLQGESIRERYYTITNGVSDIPLDPKDDPPQHPPEEYPFNQ